MSTETIKNDELNNNHNQIEPSELEQSTSSIKSCNIDLSNKEGDVIHSVDSFSIKESRSIDKKDEDPKLDNLSRENDKLISDKKLIVQTTICQNMSDSSKLSQNVELSNDYLIQMMNKLNDREIALYEGTFLGSSVEIESPKVTINQNLLPVQESSVTDVSNSIKIIEECNENKCANDDNINKESLLPKEKIEMVDESNTLSTVKDVTNESNSKINDNKEQILLQEKTIINVSNTLNGVEEIDNESRSKLNNSELVLFADDSNVSKLDNKISIKESENIDLQKASLQDELKNDKSTVNSETIIHRIQNLQWLKSTSKSDAMGTNKKKSLQRTGTEKEECIQGLAEDTKTNKSTRRHSSQSKSRKSRAADSSKQNSTENQNRRSSIDTQLQNTLKNETLGSASTHVVDRPKVKKDNQSSGSQKSFTTKTRNERRRLSDEGSQIKGHNDANNDQKSKVHKTLPDLDSDAKIPTIESKDTSKSKIFTSIHRVSDKIKKIDGCTENILITDTSGGPKELEVCEAKIDSRLHNDKGFSRNKPLDKDTVEYNKSSFQENEIKIDTTKEQLIPVNDKQEDQVKSDSISLSRPIFGRPKDDTNSGNIQCLGKGFDDSKNETIEKNNQPSQKQNSNIKDQQTKFQELHNRNQNLGKHIENKSHESFKQENSSNKNASYNNTYNQECPRWNHNYTDKQNVKSNESTLHKSFTSNRHRNIDENDKIKTEELFNRNQGCFDKSQGNGRYPENYQDSKSFGDKLSYRNQENKKSTDQYFDRNQDYRIYSDRYSDKNQGSRFERDKLSNKNHDVQTDRYPERNQDIRGFGFRYSGRNEDRAFDDRYSDRVRDSKSSEHKYFDKSQQSKTFTGGYYATHQELKSYGNEGKVITKSQETLNRDLRNSDKNQNSQNYYDKSQTVSKSQDSLNVNQIIPGNNQNCKNYDDTNQIKKEESLSRHVHFNLNQDNKRSDNKGYDSSTENYKSQNASNKIENSYKDQYNSQKHREKLDKFSNKFSITYEHENWDEEPKNLNVKSQKHNDNIQQVQVQKGLTQIQQSYSVPCIIHQQELPPSFNQNIDSNLKVTHLKDVDNGQEIQNMNYSPYKSILRHGAVKSSKLKSTSPYADVKMETNSAVANEYNLEYNQDTLLNSSNQFTGISENSDSRKRTNVVMAFEGNQNVQRALGIASSATNQASGIMSEMNICNTSRSVQSNTNSPVSIPVFTNANVNQFFQSLTPATENLQSTLIYPLSTMNVNAPPFEATQQSNPQSNNQIVHAVESSVSKAQIGLVPFENGCVTDVIRMNELSNNSEEFLKLHQEISDLSKKLALKQSQLLALQMKYFNVVLSTNTTQINQPTNLPHQLPVQTVQLNNKQLIQEQNQIVPPNYVQTAHSNASPGYGDVQKLEMQTYEMSKNATSLNVANYGIDKLSSNNGPEQRLNVQPMHLGEANLYQQPATNYQVYADNSANCTTHHIQMMSQGTEQRSIRGGRNQFYN